MALSDLRDVDFNDPSSWPTGFKIFVTLLICASILFAGYWFIVKDQIAELERQQNEEALKRREFAEKKELAINLVAYRQQIEEIKDTFGILLQQLPDKTEVPELLIEITQAGLGRGLLFELFKPQNRRTADFYAELPISLQVTGTYHELGNFVSDLAAIPRIVTIGDLLLKPVGGSKLRMTAVIKTYHYLDDDSVAEQRKNKKNI